MSQKAKNILFLSAEVAPFVKVGGLSQVMYFLPRALNKRGLDVRIFTPKYGVTRLYKEHGGKYRPKTESLGLEVPVNGKRGQALVCNVLSVKPRGKDALVYFLENREYYELRANVFGYKDDHTRFALLTKGCLEWLLIQQERIKQGEKNVWWPEVIHCHDWHTSYFIELARRNRRYKALMRSMPIVLTVHNFKYQGVMDFRYVREKDRDDGSKPLEPLLSDKLRQQNALMRGIQSADAVNTVSPTHALEVLTPEYSEGLLDTLQKNRGKLSGILNGLDIKEFNPATDAVIKRQYNSSTFAKARPINKKDLQREFQLPQNPAAPVFGFVGRLSSQKGLELIIESIPHLMKERADVQVIMLGGGDEKYRKALNQLKKDFPNNIGLFLYSDFRLSRKIFAGSDMVLMPSIFEPGGIVALEALRFGAVPIIRRTGGLSDSIQNFDSETLEGNGFVFNEKDAWSLYGTMVEALCIYGQEQLWKRLVRNAMNSVVTWDHAAEGYEDWYNRSLSERQRLLKQKRRGARV